MGQLLHTPREGGVPISLMPHATALSARYRVGVGGAAITNKEHEFKGAHIITIPKYCEG